MVRPPEPATRCGPFLASPDGVWDDACMARGSGWLALAGVTLAVAVASPVWAQVEIESSKPQPPKRLEIVPSSPGARETTRTPEADFYGEDLRVPFDPAFIEPFVGTTKGGTKVGASGWTAP